MKSSRKAWRTCDVIRWLLSDPFDGSQLDGKLVKMFCNHHYTIYSSSRGTGLEYILLK